MKIQSVSVRICYVEKEYSEKEYTGVINLTNALLLWLLLGKAQQKQWYERNTLK